MVKLTRGKLIKKCDRLFSIFIRLHFADDEWYVRCYTCWKRMKWNDKDCSCWHRISRSFYRLRWYINNARPQCMWRCNSKLSGNGEQLIFRKWLIEEVWLEEVEKMENDYIEYRQNVRDFKVHTSEIETKIVTLKELIQKEADRIWIMVKV